MSKFENEIKKSVKENTKVSSEIKEMVWENIERDINRTEQNSKSKKRNRIGSFSAGIVAASMLVFGGFATESGQAVVKNIKEMFVPEKLVEISVEGEESQMTSLLHDGTETDTQLSTYIIYYDEEMYGLTKEGEKDVIKPKSIADNLPLVSMEISQIPTESVEKAVNDIKSELEDTFSSVSAENVTTPIQATKLHAVDGSEWNSLVKNVYIFDNKKDGVFIIEENYFLEASEGHAARFEQMLKEFKIVE